MYGPTETTIWSSVGVLSNNSKISIGSPIANTWFFVLDVKMQLCADNQPGELFIADLNFVGSVDNVSVIEVTAEAASYADMCMQTGASTYEWVNIVRNTY